VGNEIQAVLDPYCLPVVNISAEARGNVERDLRKQSWYREAGELI